MSKKPSSHIEITEVTRVTVQGVEGFFAKVVTKFGTGAKIDCPKRYLGREVFVIIRGPSGRLPSGADSAADPAATAARGTGPSLGPIPTAQPALASAAAASARGPRLPAPHLGPVRPTPTRGPTVLICPSDAPVREICSTDCDNPLPTTS